MIHEGETTGGAGVTTEELQPTELQNEFVSASL